MTLAVGAPKPRTERADQSRSDVDRRRPSSDCITVAPARPTYFRKPPGDHYFEATTYAPVSSTIEAIRSDRGSGDDVGGGATGVHEVWGNVAGAWEADAGGGEPAKRTCSRSVRSVACAAELRGVQGLWERVFPPSMRSSDCSLVG